MMDACDDNDPSNIDVKVSFSPTVSFEKNSYTMENWQNLACSLRLYGYPTDVNGTGGSPAKVPDVNAEDNSTSRWTLRL